MNREQIDRLIEFIKTRPPESECVEYKQNSNEPDRIGQTICAIANAAALHRKHEGLIVWGVDDGSRNIVGTAFDPSTSRAGNQPVKIYWASQIKPSIAVEFEEIRVESLRLVVARVPPTVGEPASFSGKRYIRVGESCTELQKHPDIERRLWDSLGRVSFELQAADSGRSTHDVLRSLDYPAYFELLGLPFPAGHDGVIEQLQRERLVRKHAGSIDTTNLGAILLSKSLLETDRLSSKSARIVVYEGIGRTRIKRQKCYERGYASVFRELIDFIMANISTNTAISRTFRVETPLYPEVAVRELVVNALIHQDLSITGVGPLIELFANRMEIFNPGTPLYEPDRFLDSPPRSRNPQLVDLMRRMGVCEQAGSGIDRVLTEIELSQLPPPRFEHVHGGVRVTLFAPLSYEEMSKEDRIRACYQHAGLRYIDGSRLTNASLRERFGLSESRHTLVSRVIADAVETKLIRRDPPEDTSRRHARYVPFWAT